MCGLLVLKEELFKDYFIKKKNFAEKKERYIRLKSELAALEHLVDKHKKKPSQPSGFSKPLQIKLERGYEDIQLNSSIKLEDGAMNIFGEVPPVIKLPCYIMPHRNNQKVF